MFPKERKRNITYKQNKFTDTPSLQTRQVSLQIRQVYRHGKFTKQSKTVSLLTRYVYKTKRKNIYKHNKFIDTTSKFTDTTSIQTQRVYRHGNFRDTAKLQTRQVVVCVRKCSHVSVSVRMCSHVSASGRVCSRSVFQLYIISQLFFTAIAFRLRSHYSTP